MNRNLSNAIRELKKFKTYDQKNGHEYITVLLDFSRDGEQGKVVPLTKIRVSKVIAQLLKRRFE